MKRASVIIPIYNEAVLLRTQIEKIVRALNRIPNLTYEIVLVENGSRDHTLSVAKQLEAKIRQVRVVSINHPSYGLAFKEGIIHAKFDILFQFDLDFWDSAFLKKSLILLDRFDIIIGSKTISRSHDNRPLPRKLLSKAIEKIIRVRFGVTMSDTHGLKAMKKYAVLPFLNSVTCTNHFFDSELLIRLYVAGYSFAELPVSLKEIRASRFPFLIRMRQTVREFIQLLSIPVANRLRIPLMDVFTIRKWKVVK